jgi:hypothetical protein
VIESYSADVHPPDCIAGYHLTLRRCRDLLTLPAEQHRWIESFGQIAQPGRVSTELDR